MRHGGTGLTAVEAVAAHGIVEEADDSPGRCRSPRVRFRRGFVAGLRFWFGDSVTNMCSRIRAVADWGQRVSGGGSFLGVAQVAGLGVRIGSVKTRLGWYSLTGLLSEETCVLAQFACGTGRVTDR